MSWLSAPTMMIWVPLVILAVYAFVIWLFLGQTFIRRWISSVGTSSIYRRVPTSIATSLPPRIALPYVLIIWSAVLVVGLFPATNAALQFSDLLMIVALLSALIIHLRPNHSRELKYTLVLGAYFASAVSVVADDIYKIFSVPVASFQPFDAATRRVVHWWPFAVCILLCLSMRFWIRTAQRFVKTGSPKFVIYTFAFLRSPAFGPLVLPAMFYAQGFAMIFLVGRYLLVEAFRRYPVVYLRSFHYEGAVVVFGRAIAPLISRIGVVQALVHGAQTGHVLVSRTSVWQFGVLETVSDDIWRDWVKDRLRSASLAIVDCSTRTESVEWEIRTSLDALGEQRVLVITTGPDTASLVAASSLIAYSRDRRGLALLRSRVKSWAGHLLGFNATKSVCIGIAVWALTFTLSYLNLPGINIDPVSRQTNSSRLRPAPGKHPSKYAPITKGEQVR